jgi:hypothetical protein
MFERMIGGRSIFDCGCHLRSLDATVSRLAFARRLATRPSSPELIDRRHSTYTALDSTMYELDVRRLEWTTDCDIPTVSLQKRALDSGATSIANQNTVIILSINQVVASQCREGDSY